MIDRNERNARYYAMRADGAKQKEAAAACGISARTAQRLEAQARSGTTAADVESARAGYVARLTADQQEATRDIISRLAMQAAKISFDDLPPAEVLKLLLRFMRYSRELANETPYNALEGLQNGGKIESNADVLTAQNDALRALANGEISGDKARQLLSLLTSARKNVAAADNEEW